MNLIATKGSYVRSILPHIPHPCNIFNIDESLHQSIVRVESFEDTDTNTLNTCLIPTHIPREKVTSVFMKLKKENDENKSVDRSLLLQSAVDRCNYKWFYNILFGDGLDQTLKGTALPIKLVITELKGFIQNMPNLKWMAKMLVTEAHFGIGHLALVVGPHAFHFFANDLVDVTEDKQEDTNIVVDMKDAYTVSLEKEDDQIINENKTVFGRSKLVQLCKKLVEWNTTKKYSRSDCNCQTFVKDLLSTLGINFEKYVKRNRHLEYYFNFVKQTGDASNRVIADPITNKPRTIKSHTELDKYAIELKQYANNNPDTNDLWILLKSYDRAFWRCYHHLNQIPQEMRDTQWKSMYDNVAPYRAPDCKIHHSCPFFDPIDTKSMAHVPKSMFTNGLNSYNSNIQKLPLYIASFDGKINSEKLQSDGMMNSCGTAILVAASILGMQKAIPYSLLLAEIRSNCDNIENSNWNDWNPTHWEDLLKKFTEGDYVFKATEDGFDLLLHNVRYPNILWLKEENSTEYRSVVFLGLKTDMCNLIIVFDPELGEIKEIQASVLESQFERAGCRALIVEQKELLFL